MAKICSICLSPTANPDAPILTMGGYGIPRYLCDDCAAHIDNATRGRDYDSIVESMDIITKRLSDKNIDNEATLSTVTEIFTESAKRAQAIKDGTYDFSLDEVEEESYEIPEDMKETEEDRALDEKDRRANEKFDKVMNWVWLAVLILALGFMVWWLFV